MPSTLIQSPAPMPCGASIPVPNQANSSSPRRTICAAGAERATFSRGRAASSSESSTTTSSPSAGTYGGRGVTPGVRSSFRHRGFCTPVSPAISRSGLATWKTVVDATRVIG